MDRVSPASDAPPGPVRSAPAVRPLAGVLYMLLAGLSFLSLTISIKVVGQSVDPLQSLFLRYLLGVVFVLPLIPAMRRAGLNLRDTTGHLIRGGLQAIAALFWFYAISRIPMAEVTAMGYLQPLYMTLGAALFFGEKLALRRMMAIAAALIGMLIVLRPGFREVQLGQLAMLVQAPLMAAGYLLAKNLGGRTSPEAVLGWMSLVVPACIAPFAFATWEPISWTNAGLLFLAAFFATVGHWAVLKALTSAPVSVTQPVTFLQLVWSVLVGALVFSEPVDAMVVLGGTVIVSAVVFIVVREQQLNRAAKPQPPLI